MIHGIDLSLRALVASVVLMIAATSSVVAQALEAGVDVGGACRLSDSRYFDDCVSEQGGHLSVWFGDRVEIGARVAFVHFPDKVHFVTLGAGSPSAPLQYESLTTSGWRRRLLQGQFAYHFLKDKYRVRPFLGAALEQRREIIDYACQPLSCEQLPASAGAGTTGTFVWRGADLNVLAGVSGLLINRIVLRGVFQFHETPEFYFAVGYRFRGR